MLLPSVNSWAFSRHGPDAAQYLGDVNTAVLYSLPEPCIANLAWTHQAGSPQYHDNQVQGLQTLYDSHYERFST